MKVEVVPHDLNWKELFERGAKTIAEALGDCLIRIHHIGSTSIPSIYAKPVIDFLIEVNDLTLVDQRQNQMESLGYEALGEHGIPGRRFFRIDKAPNIRLHNVHIFKENSENIQRHLAFRDYLIAHPTEAQPYSELKQELARQFPDDIYGYMDGKDAMIKELEVRALKWWVLRN